jgi:Arc/MetJ-type ribon-helix-helix transcriptional regulator
MSKNPERRISVCIDPEVAKALDDHVAHTANTNRSHVVEQSLRVWLSRSLARYTDKEQVLQEAMKLYEEHQERELYKAYYAELNDQSRAGTAVWTQSAEETAAKHWSRFAGKE